MLRGLGWDEDGLVLIDEFSRAFDGARRADRGSVKGGGVVGGEAAFGGYVGRFGFEGILTTTVEVGAEADNDESGQSSGKKGEPSALRGGVPPGGNPQGKNRRLTQQPLRRLHPYHCGGDRCC